MHAIDTVAFLWRHLIPKKDKQYYSLDVEQQTDILLMVSSREIKHNFKAFFYSALQIGTFGQPVPWDVYNPATYQHPMVPYDVLVDPMSLPVHPVIAQRESTHEVIHLDSKKDGEDKVWHCSQYRLRFFCSLFFRLL